MRKDAAALALVATLAATTTRAAAQNETGSSANASDRVANESLPAWMFAWSPLRPIADQPRHLVRAAPLPDLLTAPAPRTGLLWSAGLAAALPDDATDTRSEFRASGASDAGDYRRPLDPDGVAAGRLSGLAWRPLGAHGAAIGDARVSSETLDRAGNADVLEPYGSSPLVATDTTNPAMRRTRAAVEGALGWRVLGFGVGLGAGVEAVDNDTRAPRVARIGRATTPGASASAARALFGGRVRLGAEARWLGGSETVSVTGMTGLTIANQLEGYADPDPRLVGNSPGYFRRVDRDARAYTGVLGFSALGIDVDGWLSRERTRLGYFSARQENPPTDHWNADGWSAGAAARWTLPGHRALVVARVRRASLDGTAERSDLTGFIVRAADHTLELSGEARWWSPDSAWGVGLVAQTAQEDRARRDYVAEAYSSITSWLPGASLEVARRILPATSVSVGAGLGRQYTSSRLPNPANMGPVYGALVAPELALYAADASARSVGVTLRQEARGASWFVRGAWESASPGAAAVGGFAPSGTRSLWSLGGGVVLALAARR